MSDKMDAAAVRVFPPAVPLATILIGIILGRALPVDVGFEPVPWVRYGAGAVIVGGAILGLGWRSVRLVRRGEQTENPFRPTYEIVEEGPFRFTRNPIYLQMVLVCFGLAVALWNIWILLLTPVCGWLLQRLAIVPEEEYLERKFGAQYLDYKRRVRRWL